MIRPYYFANKRGLKPIGIEIMLRMYLMQIWFNLSDEGIEDSIYDSYAMRSFMHIDFHEQQVPDASTLLKFRHMLETNKLGEKLSADVNSRLDKAGLMMHGGTIVDASLIAAPKSTKNQEGKRDPEMHQTKNGNEKSAVRCKVEHPFLIVKKQMGYSKVVYRGIAKNMHRFHMLFASVNLIMCSRAGRTKDFIWCIV